jgi:predicted nucleotidyltransferase
MNKPLALNAANGEAGANPPLLGTWNLAFMLGGPSEEDNKMEVGSVAQQTVLQRFIEACRDDPRVLAAFLGGSFAGGTADEYSDLDIYLVTTSEAYDDFFSERHSFMRRLGEPVFLEDFNTFGFDMLIFTYSDGVEGELALAPESQFEHIHGGPYKVLVDKKRILEGKEFPLLAPTEDQQLQTLQHLIYWFWEDLSHFITGMNRGQLWLAYSYIEQMRRKCVNLAHLRHDFTVELSGYAKVEQDVPEEQLLPLHATFCPLDPEAMLQAARTIVSVYKQIAPSLGEEHGIEYPADLERVLLDRLEELRKPAREEGPHVS